MSARLRPRRYCPNKGAVHPLTKFRGLHPLSSLSKHTGPQAPQNLQSSVSLLCHFCSCSCCNSLFSLPLSQTRSVWLQTGWVSGGQVAELFTGWRTSLFVLGSTSSLALTDVFSGAVEEQNGCMDLHVWLYGYKNPSSKYWNLCTSWLSRQALKTYGLILTQSLS